MNINDNNDMTEFIDTVDTVDNLDAETIQTTQTDKPKRGRKDFFNITELSGLINRNPDTIRKQLNKANLKPTKQGKYSLVKVKEIFEEAQKRDLRNIGSDNANSKARKIQLECEILQAKLDQIKGNQISKDEHISKLLDSHQLIKQQLINLPKEVSQLTSDNDAVKAVKKLVEKLCNDISEKFKKLSDEQNERKGERG